MKHEELTCILCPSGCDISIDDIKEDGVLVFSGCRCERGKEWAISEVCAPLRVLTTSIVCRQGELPLVSVKSDRPIPKDSIMKIILFLRTIVLDAPVEIGCRVASDPCGIPCNIIVTRECGCRDAI